MESENEFKWELVIRRTNNGYTIIGKPNTDEVIQEDEHDELKAHQELLWLVMEYFSFVGSKHDPERIRIVREKKESENDSE